jgi:predicted nucleic acid-binding protein
MKKKRSAYLESTVISYATASARARRDQITEAKRLVTIDWWKNVLPSFEAFVSEFVIEEVGRGTGPLAVKRVAEAKKYRTLERTKLVEDLAEKYLERIRIPDHAAFDAFHLALATAYEIDYLVSWNLVHIANERTRHIVHEINDQFDLKTPRICTPLEPMET